MQAFEQHLQQLHAQCAEKVQLRPFATDEAWQEFRFTVLAYLKEALAVYASRATAQEPAPVVVLQHQLQQLVQTGVFTEGERSVVLQHCLADLPVSSGQQATPAAVSASTTSSYVEPQAQHQAPAAPAPVQKPQEWSPSPASPAACVSSAAVSDTTHHPHIRQQLHEWGYSPVQIAHALASFDREAIPSVADLTFTAAEDSQGGGCIVARWQTHGSETGEVSLDGLVDCVMRGVVIKLLPPALAAAAAAAAAVTVDVVPTSPVLTHGGSSHQLQEDNGMQAVVLVNQDSANGTNGSSWTAANGADSTQGQGWQSWPAGGEAGSSNSFFSTSNGYNDNSSVGSADGVLANGGSAEASVATAVPDSNGNSAGRVDSSPQTATAAVSSPQGPSPAQASAHPPIRAQRQRQQQDIAGPPPPPPPVKPFSYSSAAAAAADLPAPIPVAKEAIKPRAAPMTIISAANLLPLTVQSTPASAAAAAKIALLSKHPSRAADGSFNDPDMGRMLMVRNLPFAATADDVAAHFVSCTNLVSVQMSRSKQIPGRPPSNNAGYCHVTFKTREDAAHAMTRLHGTELLGHETQPARPLVLERMLPRDSRPTKPVVVTNGRR